MCAPERTYVLKNYRQTGFDRGLRNVSFSALMPMLPLIHKADTVARPDRNTLVAEDYFAGGAIRPVPCDVFGEDLIYTYVGRPAYRELLRPVCFILRPAPELLQNLFIFDTGAYCTNRYGKIVDNVVDVNHFRIPAEADTIRRFIIRYFGDNESYYWGLPRDQHEIEMMDSLEEFDYSMLMKVLRFSRLGFDTRCRTLENILRTPISLEKYLQGVILPESRSAGAAFMAYRDRCGADLDILLYDDERGQAGAGICNSRLDAALFEYYADKGYMTNEP